MGEVIYNRVEASGKSIDEVLDAQYSGFDGLNSDRFKEGLDALKENASPDGYGEAEALRKAIAGTIDGFLNRGELGVYFWDHPPSPIRNSSVYEHVTTINTSRFYRYTERYRTNNRYGHEWP
jgi:hypothetical protein